MKNRFCTLTLGWLALVASWPTWGQIASGQQEALQWLQRVADAAQKVSYSGTFVYQSGGHQGEASRIVHLATADGQREKVEVLDGSPREVVRHNDEVKYYLPESRQVIVEQRGSQRDFPALLPANLAGLSDNYTIRKAGNARIAGLDSQVIRLDPRDPWRYGHRFWVAQESGLLLKADIFDGRGESIESLAFTELRIGVPPDPVSAVRSSYAEHGWQTRQVKLRELRDDAHQWLFRAELPGFRRQAAMLRTIPQPGGETVEMMHWVLSDGLAALSVFITPLYTHGGEAEPGAQLLGAISIAKRVIGNHQIVVMGDVPPAAVRRFADGIATRGK